MDPHVAAFCTPDDPDFKGNFLFFCGLSCDPRKHVIISYTCDHVTRRKKVVQFYSSGPEKYK